VLGWNGRSLDMPIDDMWYLSKRGPDSKRAKSKLYGKGKRWRCRYENATGQTRIKYF
jgi:hypothetical protein